MPYMPFYIQHCHPVKPRAETAKKTISCLEKIVSPLNMNSEFSPYDFSLPGVCPTSVGGSVEVV